MSRKRKKANTEQALKQKSEHARRKFISRAVTIVGGVAIAGASYGAFRLRHNRLYDLSVIGNGKPTVVQLHDPTCPKCRALKSNVESVKSEFKDVQFRIAHLSSEEGSRLAHKYGVGKVTLLVFDGGGKMVETIQGVYPESQLRREFGAL
ncbi:MAG: thioredoxin family protein [Pseudomonadota bacterium]